MSRSWLLYLDDLIESAEKVSRFIRGHDASTFAANEVVFDAVLFNLQVIGGAMKKLPEGARNGISESDRSAPARLRDLIAHHYFAIDPEIIWEVATDHVPRLLEKARSLRETVEDI